MKIEQIKQHIRDNAIFEKIEPEKQTGQRCGILSHKVSLYSDDLRLRIETDFHGNDIKNKKLLLSILDIAINELIY